MPIVDIIYGGDARQIEVQAGTIIGEAVLLTGLPLEQPCAGRGTCGLCKVLVEVGAERPDRIERQHLTPGELAVGNRLACRARIRSEARVVLAPIVVYSNKIFRSSTRYKSEPGPLGLAIDLGSTTVAAFLTMLDSGIVQAGAASLNQQTVFGADVVSRLQAAIADPENAQRLHRLAVASINHAVDSLRLSRAIRKRIERVVIVCNVAMHHLLVKLPLDTLAVMPFQPNSMQSIGNGGAILEGIFPDTVQVRLPPLIGGFVGSDALACLAYFNFKNPPGPLAAIDLGTNGEVLVTNGKRILTASTAAGPAFEGVNISCGTRAVDGAIVKARIDDDRLVLETIGDLPPVGMTGSGLLSLVHVLRQAGAIDASGRILPDHPFLAGRLMRDSYGYRAIKLAEDGRIALTQWDIRELQKAKGAIRAAFEVLMLQLGLDTSDLYQVILTGSFGGQVDIKAALDLGMLPDVLAEKVVSISNGAGYGAAMFLNDEGFAFAEKLAALSEQVDLDRDENFFTLYVGSMFLQPNRRLIDST